MLLHLVDPVLLLLLLPMMSLSVVFGAQRGRAGRLFVVVAGTCRATARQSRWAIMVLSLIWEYGTTRRQDSTVH